MLRGSTIRHVNIINRRFSESSKDILRRLYVVPAAIKEREGWKDAQFGILTPGYGEFQRLLRDQVRAADVIFCCTPSQEPLFEHSILTSGEGRRKGRLIIAIGSYTPDMIELPVELLLQAVKRSEPGQRHFHKHATEGGVVIVDTLDGAMQEAGEIIQGGLNPSQLIE
jgi:ornithine cyclodeaminase/alanine dehydrogenase-like protein (mu-crystallin family)